MKHTTRATLGIGLLVMLGVTACADEARDTTDAPDSAAADADMDGMESEGTENSAPDGSGMQAMMEVLERTESEGMRIEVATSEPTTFTIFQGDQTREVTPKADDSLHLMAVLADDESGERIPYAEVWATITDAQGEVVFDERLWPMISRGMGTHYGTNVPIPEAGSYEVSMQVGPPQAARHPEYTDRWLEPVTVETMLDWQG